MATDRDEPPHTTRGDELLEPLRSQGSSEAETKRMHRLLEIGEDLQRRVSTHLPPDTLPAPAAHAGTLAAIAELRTAAEKQVTAARAQYDEFREAVARLSDPVEDRHRADPVGAGGDEAARELATRRVIESAALLDEKVALLGRLCDGLEAVVQSIQRPKEVPAAADPASGSPGTFQAASGIPEAHLEALDAWRDDFIREVNALLAREVNEAGVPATDAGALQAETLARVDRITARLSLVESEVGKATATMAEGLGTVTTALSAHGESMRRAEASNSLTRKQVDSLQIAFHRKERAYRQLRHLWVSLPVIVVVTLAGMLLESQMFLFTRLFR